MSLTPVVCQYVTEDCLREWKNGNTAFRVSVHGPVIRFVYELSWAVVRGIIPPQKCKIALESFENSDRISEEEMGSNFADVVAQLGQDVTMTTENRSRLIKLAKWLVDSALVPLRLFQERCEEEFLSESEMIKIKAQDLKAKEVRVNTRLLYQQTKFNLLREESEGYAKLVTLLCYGSEVPSPSASSATIGVIKSLIGHFDLDPNRVFDIVLECFELQPDNSIFLDLIPIFPRSHASQILGFKFQFYQRSEVNILVPYGLYRLTALLVREGFIDLDCIYAHLLPNDDEAFEHYSVFSSKRMDEANKIGRINLAATGKDLMDDEKPGDVTIDLYAALDMETAAAAEYYSEVETGQTLGLLSGFLYVKDWHHARILLDHLAPLNPVAHVQICEGLFRLIENSISSAYDVVCQTRFRDGSPLTSTLSYSIDDMVTNSYGDESLIDLPKHLFEMLTAVGPYFHRNAILLQKVCRVLRAYYLSALGILKSENAISCSEIAVCANWSPRSHFKDVRGRIEGALGTCLLPSLQLIPANPAVGQEIWEVMNLLPYEVRYRLYGEWEKDDERIPLVVAARQTAKLDTRRILKRLAKENLKQLGRMIAKLAHANPMTVLRTIVHQIEAYRDMITPVVDAFKYLTQLEYDVLEYVVMERLALGGRQKLKDDGLHLSDWLQSLASFWGHLCKKYPSMELRGLFQYLVNQLKKGSGVELVVLQELIQQMANVQYTENMTEEQLDAMAGSESLRYHATSFGMYRNNKALIKSTSRLRDALLPIEEPKLALPLLLLVAQHRSIVVINADAPYIKSISEQFDRCHGTLLQYVEFLNSAVTPATAYAQLVPTLDALVHQYHLDPEVAFLIYRPVMRLFRRGGSVYLSWPLNDEEYSPTAAGENESDVCSTRGSLVLDIGSSQLTWLDLLETVSNMLPSKAWNSLSPDLYVTFWGLNLYDLFVPNNRYESEVNKLHTALKALEDASDNSSSAISKRKKEKERIQESLDRLNNELLKHEEHVASVRRRLSREKDTWLSSCPDTLKINMEFLQRCIFPRCTFSMPDAVYCAMFVQTLHSLQTPFFNTVNHIDVLICKTLQPMICCCTEYEAGRLGRFLYETLKMAYYWKNDEAVYERECGNMPGFAVYYRFPNSQRVTYSQFIKVHWKWSQRITRLLIQCLESTEYMEIRNALIMLTKISGIFPVTRKSGINLEKRVAKIKSDEREDLKVLATGVAASLAARKSSWITEEEFGMGYLELKPPLLSSKPAVSVAVALNSSAIQTESVGGTSVAVGGSNPDFATPVKDPRTKHVDLKLERAEALISNKSDFGNLKSRGGSLLNGSDLQSAQVSSSSHPASSKLADNQNHIRESVDRSMDEGGQVNLKAPGETESRAAMRRVYTGSLHKSAKQEPGKDDGKSVKGNGALVSIATKGSSSGEVKGEGGGIRATEFRGSTDDVRRTLSSSVHSPPHDSSATLKPVEKQQKRISPVDESERLIKRRKGDSEDSEIRLSDKEKASEPRQIRGEERHDLDYRDRSDKLHTVEEKFRERSHGRERSVERVADKFKEEKIKDEKGKLRYYDIEKSHVDDRFHSPTLPPPPPLPPNVVPQSMRRDDEVDRKINVLRHTQRLSPRHDDKDRRRSEENSLISTDDTRRRREEDIRERRRDDPDVLSIKVDEREREREKPNMAKEEMDVIAASKRRKLKREYNALSIEPGEYNPAVLPPLNHASSHPYDGRERLDRKGSVLQQRAAYPEDPAPRLHPKDVPGKFNRHDVDINYDREWEEEKRQRAESKRRHRK